VRDFPQTYASQAKVEQLEFELSEHNTSLQSKMDSILERVDAKLNDFSKQYKEDFRYLLETNGKVYYRGQNYTARDEIVFFCLGVKCK